MILYVMRHGKAEGNGPDDKRPLSAEGQGEVARVASQLKEKGVSVHLMLHSEKLRAKETAEIVARELGAGDGLIERAGLKPNDPVQPVVNDIDELADNGKVDSVMIVGHLPFVHDFSYQLLKDAGRDASLDFSTSCVTCLEGSRNKWEFRWRIT